MNGRPLRIGQTRGTLVGPTLSTAESRAAPRRPPPPPAEAGLRIWIDADAASRRVIELAFRKAKGLAVEVVLVARRRLHTPPGNPLVSSVRVEGGTAGTDQYIANQAVAGDLVVTQDVPLAARLTPQGITVLDPRGREHPADRSTPARAREAFAAALEGAVMRLRRWR